MLGEWSHFKRCELEPKPDEYIIKFHEVITEFSLEDAYLQTEWP